MCYFPFNKESLSTLPPAIGKEADLAVRTAEKMCEYYQYYARSLYNGNDTVHDVKFTPEEAALTSEIIKRKNAFRIPKTRQGQATLKLFYAGQMHFYMKYPHMIDPLFGEGGKTLMLALPFFKAGIPNTYKPVDDYFNDAVDKMVAFARGHYGYNNDNNKKPPHGPRPNMGLPPAM